MSYDQDDPRIVYMPEAEITKAYGHCDVMRNRWFAVHPERGLVFWQIIRSRKGKLQGAAPQCNGDKSIADRIIAPSFPWAEVKFFETVIVPINVSDY